MRQQPETIGDVVLLYVKQHYGTQAAAAIAWSCSTTMLNQVIQGERRPTQRMLNAIGYRYVETWLPQAMPLPADALSLAASQPADEPRPLHRWPEGCPAHGVRVPVNPSAGEPSQ